MITSRDLEVVEFLKQNKAATTSAITKLFFGSQSACRKRMKVLVDAHQVKRARDFVNCEYIYFIKQPAQLKHTLLVTNFYAELSRQSEVVNFKREPVLGDIRPDAVFGYKIGNKGFVGLLEVEISNKGFNWGKYQKFFNGQYKDFFPAAPSLFIVSDTTKPNPVVPAVLLSSDLSLFRVQ